jgi:hypothetical protein
MDPKTRSELRKKSIYAYIKAFPRSSSFEIAGELKINWYISNSLCLELFTEKKIIKETRGKRILWRLPKDAK